MAAEFLYRPSRPDQPFLLAADIDRTLLGDDDGEIALKAFARNHHESFVLAYVTGRYRSSVQKLVDEGRLTRPDLICSNVGSDIFALDDSENFLGQKYASQVGPDWDLETIYNLGDGQGIRRQDFGEDQPPFQAGFDWDGQPQTLEAFHSRLASLDHFHILSSYGEFIDVLPGPLGKGKVVGYLQKELASPRSG